ncbi:unnamed protein product [Lymnaea stagnalis]|uniref:protein-tyrosine-phosphatase n=1 Tax=Lymnaea stagnalis TaxID=6523 RepID=A0AAV2HJH8_LYMST
MHLTVIVFVTLCMSSHVTYSACPSGWFGSNCTFQCHCTSNCTTPTTECPSNYECDKEWFGAACQYKDLSNLTTTTIDCNPKQNDITWLIDRNDNTCNPANNSQSVVISFIEPYPYTWLRIAVNDAASFNSLQVSFKTNSSADMACTNQIKTTIDAKRIDIRCNTMFDVKQVIVQGQGLRSLCSVYINGGRNVALKQLAVQSSTYSGEGEQKADATNAVDGVTTNIFNKGSCTHTNPGHQSPNWNLTFIKHPVVNRFVLYNRNEDCCIDRLKHFTLQTLDANDKTVYQYTDPNDAPQINYAVTVAASARNIPIRKINIRATSNILTLCEVEAFGDCSPGSWGLDCVLCEGKCNQCHPETGACLVCNGYTNPPNCDQTCPDGNYGINCAQRCSTNCSQNLCDAVTGFCKACPNGYKGSFCDQVCESGKWGPQCANTCNESCWDSSCNNVNGTCDYGCDGFSDVPFCTEVCILGKWGKNCSQDCSKNCYNQSCNRLNGTCDDGCLGYSNPPSCNITCPFGKWGKNCQDQCSSNCYNTSCDRRTGICDQGCSGYINPPDCNIVCDHGTWGANCSFPCNNSCFNASCNHRNGSCDLGCDGFNNPPVCTEECPSGYWGQNCTLACSSHCSNASCDGQTGECYLGCMAGYLPPKCEQGCKETFYGINCSKVCSNNCSKNQCDSNIGYCLRCIDNHEGHFCEAISASPETPVGAIVGSIIAVIVICVFILLAVVFWRRRQAFLKSKMNQGVEIKEQNRSSTFDRMEFSDLENTKIAAEAIYNNVAAYKVVDSQPIAVKDLSTFLHSHKMDYFENQYKKIPAPKNVTTEMGMNSLNKHKNRYKNICPYDHSRVHLEINTTKNEEDYINASYVEGFNKDDKFIASQGPNKVILKDFVRMLWEQRVDKVVMLTNLIEEGTVKCEKYWPDDGILQFGEIQVKMISTETFADYAIRVLELSRPREAGRTFTQFHFTTWPDKGVPEVPWGLVDFEQRVFSQPTSRPIVVHCSAGVGRTGTFIALHNVMREAEQTGHVDFFKTVVKLRQDRILMIQTAEQYWFLHKAAQVAILCIGTTVTSGNIVGRIKHLEETSLTGKTKMEAEFKAVSTVCEDSKQDLNNRANESPETDGNVYQNSDEIIDKLKNRFSNIIPNQKYRPFLACETRDMKDYINAVFLPGFKKRDQQLLTQLPMPKTVVDFWRLVAQYSISLIVAFDVDAMLTDETFGHYLPQGADQGLKCSPFLITLKDIKKSTLWEEHKLMVEIEMRKSLLSPSPNNNERQEVIHLKCLLTDLDPDKLLSILRQIRSYNALTNGRIVYTCRDGAKYSGLVCVLSLLLDRMEHDSCLTVPLVVGMIKTIRPEVIPNLDQYRVLYDVLGRYSDNTVTYGNIGNVAQNGAVVSKENAKPSFNEEQHTNIYANY